MNKKILGITLLLSAHMHGANQENRFVPGGYQASAPIPIPQQNQPPDSGIVNSPQTPYRRNQLSEYNNLHKIYPYINEEESSLYPTRRSSTHSHPSAPEDNHSPGFHPPHESIYPIQEGPSSWPQNDS